MLGVRRLGINSLLWYREPQMTKVFLSHSSVDKPFVRNLAKDLEAAGLQVWLDENVIKLGDSIINRINEGLNNTDFTLLIISASFLSSNWAIWEANAVIVEAIKAQKSSVIPILIEDVWNNVSPLLRDKLYLDFRNHSNLLEYRAALNRLISTLLSHTAAPVAKKPIVMVTGGRDPGFTIAFQAAYELGKLLGVNRFQMMTGVALGVDENFARGANDALLAIGADPRTYLTVYSGRGGKLHHSFGKILQSRFRFREEGIPELVSNADIVVLMAGGKNTNYVGVLSLLEDKVVLPVDSTDGAASDLYSLVLNRYNKIFGSLLDKARFEDLADRSRSPKEIADACYDLIKLISGL
jgi:hypothetical protein